MERMLTANQGLRRRFPTVIRFDSYTPDELWKLTEMMAAEYQDVLADDVEAVLRPVFERYYLQANSVARRRRDPRDRLAG